jgi:hypothetical protein
MSTGKIHDSKTMFLRMHVGEATDNETGIEYEMSTDLASGQPIIHSKKTGKWWSCGWQDLIELAVKAGIDTEQS